MELSRLDVKTRVGDQAYEALHAAIVSGAFEAGRRLQIRDLAENLGISVMPVREAIKRLEEVGLVETEPYRGAVVKRLTRSELLQIYAVRKLLEVEATRLGVERVTSGDIDEVLGYFEQLEQSLEDEDIAPYLDFDEAILLQIYSASGNAVLVDTIRSLWYRCRVYKVVGARDERESGSRAELLEYQQKLIDAMRAGDAEQAAKITEQSLDAAIERIRLAMPVEDPVENPVEDED